MCGDSQGTNATTSQPVVHAPLVSTYACYCLALIGRQGCCPLYTASLFRAKPHLIQLRNCVKVQAVGLRRRGCISEGLVKTRRYSGLRLFESDMGILERGITRASDKFVR
ncbi:hypothetical protein HRR84_001328 [Exophiala dermatitidis]|nr:hypothetical protein HRR84_001328 [Exophiala dermatitidis]